MSAVTRRTGPSPAGLALLTVVMVTVTAAAAVWTVAEWFITGRFVPINPVYAVLSGTAWTGAHTAAAVVLGVLVGAVAIATLVATRRSDRAKEDRAAVHMGRGNSIAPLQPRAIAKLHRQLGMDSRTHLGLSLGTTVVDGLPVRASFESSVTVIAGPGRHKSTALVIPNVLDAPGTVITTSLKADVLQATIGHRATVGTVHVFDPQEKAPMAAGDTVWWNPLAGIRTIEDAENLATVFSASYVDSSSEGRFFEREGVRLLADYMFAAAHADEHLPIVLRWLVREDSPHPANWIRDTHPAIAGRIDAAQAVTERTRSGVFAYARGAVSFLASEQLSSWVQPGRGRRELDPALLVAAPRDTLYLISQEGNGSAAPLVSALTKTLLDAAEHLSEHSPRERLIPPLVAILDEAGNICRIPDLPDRYSHYRSRGIVVMTILQSQEQGEHVWPNGGFGELWAASSVQVYAGGNASPSFYRDLSERIGDYEYTERSTNASNRGGSTQISRRTERIMDVRDLDALSLGRMIVLASSCRPTLVRTRPWFTDKRLRALVATERPTPPTRSVGGF